MNNEYKHQNLYKKLRNKVKRNIFILKKETTLDNIKQVKTFLHEETQ